MARIGARPIDSNLGNFFVTRHCNCPRHLVSHPASHPLARVVGDERPERLVRPSVLLLQRPAQDPSCTAPIFRRAPLPRPLCIAARASRRCTPSTSNAESTTAGAGGEEQPASPVLGSQHELPFRRPKPRSSSRTRNSPTGSVRRSGTTEKQMPRPSSRSTRAASRRGCSSEADCGGGAITCAISSRDSNASSTPASAVSHFSEHDAEALEDWRHLAPVPQEQLGGRPGHWSVDSLPECARKSSCLRPAAWPSPSHGEPATFTRESIARDQRRAPDDVVAAGSPNEGSSLEPQMMLSPPEPQMMLSSPEPR